jgi:hypothetical protein
MIVSFGGRNARAPELIESAKHRFKAYSIEGIAPASWPAEAFVAAP